MRIVVTGGQGLIGGRLIQRLVPAHDVWSIVRHPSTGSTAMEIAGDLSQSVLPAGLPDRADAVIHLAQSRHFRDLPERADDVFAVNVASTARLLDWARSHGVSQFILASTGSVGKSSGTGGFYVASRQCAEWLAQTYAPYFSVLVTRFFFAYGPEQSSSMLIPRLIDSVRSGTKVTLAGDQGLLMNPVHVDDAARTLEACLAQRANGTIDVAGPDTVTLRELAVLIGQLVGREPRFEIDRAAAPQELIGDATRMVEIAGPHQWSITAGLRDMAARTTRA